KSEEIGPNFIHPERCTVCAGDDQVCTIIRCNQASGTGVAIDSKGCVQCCLRISQCSGRSYSQSEGSSATDGNFQVCSTRRRCCCSGNGCSVKRSTTTLPGAEPKSVRHVTCHLYFKLLSLCIHKAECLPNGEVGTQGNSCRLQCSIPGHLSSKIIDRFCNCCGSTRHIQSKIHRGTE